jgi:hypothetical protein
MTRVSQCVPRWPNKDDYLRLISDQILEREQSGFYRKSSYQFVAYRPAIFSPGGGEITPLCRPPTAYSETGFTEISSDVLQADFGTTSSESALDVTSGSASSDREQRQTPIEMCKTSTPGYLSFANSTFACFRMGTSGSAFFHRLRKSL